MHFWSVVHIVSLYLHTKTNSSELISLRRCDTGIGAWAGKNRSGDSSPNPFWQAKSTWIHNVPGRFIQMEN